MKLTRSRARELCLLAAEHIHARLEGDVAGTNFTTTACCCDALKTVAELPGSLEALQLKETLWEIFGTEQRTAPILRSWTPIWPFMDEIKSKKKRREIQEARILALLWLPEFFPVR